VVVKASLDFLIGRLMAVFFLLEGYVDFVSLSHGRDFDPPGLIGEVFYSIPSILSENQI